MTRLADLFICRVVLPTLLWALVAGVAYAIYRLI